MWIGDVWQTASMEPVHYSGANESPADVGPMTDLGGGEVSRWGLLAGAATLAVGGVLASCGESSESGPVSASARPEKSPEPETSPSLEKSIRPDTSTDVPDDSAVIAFTSTVPVGGTTVVRSRGLVVSQPTSGTLRSFEASCPHQGCSVSETEGKDLLCPCHESLFSSETGEVLRGPAKTGLPRAKIKVYGTRIETD